MKKCSKCGRTLSKSNFYIDKSKKDSLHSQCKDCDNKYMHENYSKIKNYKQSFQGKYSEYKSESKKCDRLFCLTFEQFVFIMQKPCIYCGTYEHIGIDRLDNKIGYEFDNCVSCCATHNMMKGNRTVLEFLIACRRVVENLQE